jgi:hypothetical protein
VLPQGTDVENLLQALREHLQPQVLEAEGTSPLQLRLLLQNGFRLNKLLQSTDSLSLSSGFQGGVYDRDALLDTSFHYRRQGKYKILLEAIPQVYMICASTHRIKRLLLHSIEL